MSNGVTLTGNRTSAPGAAICNAGGSIGLAGGTITGNQSAGIVNEAAEITGGAIYSLGEIRVSGAVIVKDNKDDGLLFQQAGQLLRYMRYHRLKQY